MIKRSVLRTSLLLSVSFSLSGCGSLSGLYASERFSCPFTPGMSCENMQTVYEKARTGRLPSQEIPARTPHTKPLEKTASEAQKTAKETPASENVKDKEETVLKAISESEGSQRVLSALPPRIPEEILRVWVAPWSDKDGDLHEATFLYLRVHGARWASARHKRAEGAALIALPFKTLRGKEGLQKHTQTPLKESEHVR